MVWDIRTKRLLIAKTWASISYRVAYTIGLEDFEDMRFGQGKFNHLPWGGVECYLLCDSTYAYHAESQRRYSPCRTCFKRKIGTALAWSLNPQAEMDLLVTTRSRESRQQKMQNSEEKEKFLRREGNSGPLILALKPLSDKGNVFEFSFLSLCCQDIKGVL